MSEEAQQLRNVAGQLNWAASQTRPDLAYGACEVSTSSKDAIVKDLKNANKYVSKIQRGWGFFLDLKFTGGNVFFFFQYMGGGGVWQSHMGVKH